MEGNPNRDRIYERLEREQQEETARRERQLEVAAQNKEEVKLKIRRACQLIVEELNRLDWPNAILQNENIFYALDNQTAIDMESELYTLPYYGDGEWGTDYTHWTNLDARSYLEGFLEELEAELSNLQAQ